ncbi:MAG: S41 family peptidase [Azospirillaceae bacterium]|nr:S41 family peptidase [Azospirillaceae bacterium]
MTWKWKKALVISTAVIAAIAVTGGIAGFAAYRLGLGPFAPFQADMAIDRAARTAVIDGAVAAIERYYVFPEKAAQMAQHLATRMAQGDFDAITSAEKLAQVLTDSLQKDTGDAHLTVRYFEKPIAELPPGQDQTPEEKAEEESTQKRLNYGFQTVSRLKSNIGYIDLRAFGRPAQAAAKIAGAMALVSDTRALIIDLRECEGGDPDTVMLFASYLFDAPTHLNDIYWRDENRIEERWTRASVSGTKYGSTRRVYVLTGENTFSAAEDFAYALKANRRAIIVGTSTQGGGAHPGQPRRINAHFMIFVPTGRAINPVTQTNWQETGVLPDLPSSESKALDVAQIEILKEVMASDPDPRARQAAKERIADLR